MRKASPRSWLFPACVGGFWLNWRFVAPRLMPASRAGRAVTLTDFLAHGLEPRQARVLRILATAIVAFALTAYVASQFKAAGLSFYETFGMSETWAILLGGAVIVVYTLLGGFWAVSLTDTLQGLVMAATAVLLAGGGAARGATPGRASQSGLQEVPDAALPGPLRRDGERSRPSVSSSGSSASASAIPGQPHVVNRFMALRDERALRNGRRYAMVWAVIIYAGMLLLGLSGRILYESLGRRGSSCSSGQRTSSSHPSSPASWSRPRCRRSCPPQIASCSLRRARSRTICGAQERDPKSRSSCVPVSSCSASPRSRCVLALVVEESIFNSVLFAWSAMGAAFGPLLLVLLLRKAGSLEAARHRLRWEWASLLSVGAFFLNRALGGAFKTEAGAALERVLPFAAAFAGGLARCTSAR